MEDVQHHLQELTAGNGITESCSPCASPSGWSVKGMGKSWPWFGGLSPGIGPVCASWASDVCHRATGSVPLPASKQSLGGPFSGAAPKGPTLPLGPALQPPVPASETESRSPASCSPVLRPVSPTEPGLRGPSQGWQRERFAGHRGAALAAVSVAKICKVEPGGDGGPSGNGGGASIPLLPHLPCSLGP